MAAVPGVMSNAKKLDNEKVVLKRESALEGGGGKKGLR